MRRIVCGQCGLKLGYTHQYEGDENHQAAQLLESHLAEGRMHHQELLFRGLSNAVRNTLLRHWNFRTAREGGELPPIMTLDDIRALVDGRRERPYNLGPRGLDELRRWLATRERSGPLGTR